MWCSRRGREPRSRLGERRTDASGRYRAGGFRPGQIVQPTVGKEGFAGASIEGVRLPDDSPVKVVLQPEASVSGRVVDGEGRPVEGAWVSEQRRRAPPMHFGRGAGITDEDGRFRLSGLPAGPLTLRAQSREHGRSEGLLLELAAGEHREGLELTLRSTPSIRVRVWRADGEPAVRATVFAMGETSGGSCLESGPDFVCSDLAPGAYHLIAAEDGHGRTGLDVVVGGSAGESPVVDLHLGPGLEISGTVRTAEGEPAAGRMLMLRGEGQAFPPLGEETTAADGSFTFRDLGAGVYKLTVTPTEGSRWFGHDSYLHPEPLILAEGGSLSGIVVRLDERATLRGRLLGLEPREIGGTRISAQGPIDGSGPQSSAPGRVLADGRYEIEGLRAGVWRIEARVEESGKHAEDEVEISPGPEDAVRDLDLRAGSLLVGTVLVGDEPLTGARVVVPGVGLATTDQRGRFRMVGVEPGEIDLFVQDDQTFPVSRTVTFEEGREVVVRFRLGSVRGTVLSAVGIEPIAGAELHLRRHEPGGDAIVFAGQTVGDGRFLLERVPQGRFTLEVVKPGFATTSVDVQVVEGAIELPEIVLQLAKP